MSEVPLYTQTVKQYKNALGLNFIQNGRLVICAAQSECVASYNAREQKVVDRCQTACGSGIDV